MEITDKNLCNSCTNIGCEFQSGIVRTKCTFYMPPHLEPDNCGNYVVQNSTTKNDLGVDLISRADAIRVASGYCHPSNVAKELAKLPSVIPQEPKSEWEHDHAILKAYSDGANEVLDKIRAEIETKYGQCDICEYFEDYDYEENDISEYRAIGNIADILQIIDKYKAESAHEVAQEIVNNNGIVDL